MKQIRVISIAVLFLLLGTTLSAFAQKGEEEKSGGGQKAQPAQHQAQPQRAQQAQRQAQPQRAQPAKAQPQRAQAQQPARQQAQTVASNRGGGQYGRISDDHYRANFGHDHSFHMGRPQMNGGFNRFQYGGYSFGYNQGWPVGWGYNDDFFVEYVDGVYYLCDLRFPGIQITLNMF